MTNNELSKTLSYVLRHKPEAYGVVLDNEGWAEVKHLLSALQHHHQHLVSLQQLQEVVSTNEKQRFSFNDANTHIRANQGHSVPVDLPLETQIPPDLLFHGTATRFLDSIYENGLLKGARHHVHLSADEAAAAEVGQRYGKPIVLRVRALAMHHDGMLFVRSANGVWLTDKLPAAYILP